MALGLLLALIVNQPIRGRAFFRSAYYFPALASSAAISVISIYLLNADGLVNAITRGRTTSRGSPTPDTALDSIIGLTSGRRRGR